MNPREKILAAVTGTAALLFIVYLAINNVFLMPAAQQFNRARDLMQQVERARAEKAKQKVYETRLKELAGRTYGTDPLRVSEQVRSRITELLGMSGLSTERLTLKPVVGAQVQGIYKEVGWLVQVRGQLEQVVNFLYLVTREPHLHRLDNLVISPVRGSSEVEVQAKYGTLVLLAETAKDLRVNTVSADLDKSLLETPDRDQYNLIASRALFRPYMPARRPEPTRPPPTPSAPSTPRPPEVPTGRYRVVGLATFADQPDIYVRDSSSGNVVRYKPGDSLGGGTIVMVDYRPMPMPDKPDILSGSRVLLRIGTEYYAVELGTYLAQKHKLRDDQLPPHLPQTQPPAASTASTDAGGKPDTQDGAHPPDG